jgi:hypothetical protein
MPIKAAPTFQWTVLNQLTRIVRLDLKSLDTRRSSFRRSFLLDINLGDIIANIMTCDQLPISRSVLHDVPLVHELTRGVSQTPQATHYH